MIIRVGGQRWASLYIRGSPGLVQYEAFHGLRPYPLTLHEPPHFPCQILNQQYWYHTLRQEIFSAPFFLDSVSLRSVCFLLLAVFGCSCRLHPPPSEFCHIGPLSLHRPLCSRPRSRLRWISRSRSRNRSQYLQDSCGGRAMGVR